MPISINGSGTVTGISVGGLPDAIVDTDMLAASAVTDAKTNLTGAIKAWVNFNGTNSNLNGSGNVTSVTDNGVGDFSVNFTNNIESADYCVTGWADNWETTNADSYGLVAGHSNTCLATDGCRIVTRRMRFDSATPVAKDFPHTCIGVIH